MAVGVQVSSQAYLENALELTVEQKASVLAQGAELIFAAASGQREQLYDPTLRGAAEKMVFGCYVSLKRGPHLRGCCGALQGNVVRLIDSLYDAAYRTAVDDPRFPVVTPGELPFLDMEISLLFNPQPLKAKGEARVKEVVAGTHGVLVHHGAHTGLLLPSVASEHGWDSRKLLEQVCVKAGMHPSFWKDPETVLVTFEGMLLAEPLKTYVEGRLPPTGRWLADEEVAGYGHLCRSNLLALVQGMTPYYSHPGLPDAQVLGVTLSVQIAGREPLQATQLSMRPGVALQSTLFGLSQTLARHLVESRITLAILNEARIDVALYTDAHVHGTIAEPDLRGHDPRSRALVLFERGKQALLYRPTANAEETLAEAAKLLKVATPKTASILSLHAETTAEMLKFTSAPNPRSGPEARPAAVAGRFYPSEPDALKKLVHEHLSAAPSVTPRQVSAALVPHAGLMHSGKIAAQVLKGIKFPGTILVIGPKHTALGMEWAVAPNRIWNLPGLQIASDHDLAQLLVHEIPGLTFDAAAHQNEHAIEVELPYLAQLAPEAKVVGIALGHMDLDDCKSFANGLAKAMKSLKEQPLLLVSSDMNHYATEEQTRLLDELALAALEKLDAEKLVSVCTDNNISMCGLMPAAVALLALKQLDKLKKATRVAYGTSADSTGETRRAVGYAGMWFEG